MNKDNAIAYLCSLVALGIVFIGATVSFLQWSIATPIIAMGIILFALVLVVNKGHWAHHLENLEKVFFFITIAVICILFIMHFRPF